MNQTSRETQQPGAQPGNADQVLEITAEMLERVAGGKMLHDTAMGVISNIH